MKKIKDIFAVVIVSSLVGFWGFFVGELLMKDFWLVIKALSVAIGILAIFWAIFHFSGMTYKSKK
jgi:succinate-acetate transporter protein